MHESVYEEFVEKAAARARRRTVGDPFKEDIEQGPQVYLPLLLSSLFWETPGGKLTESDERILII